MSDETKNKTKKAYKVIIRPLITEKMAIEASKNKYGFLVNRNATKKDIKEAVEEVYNVKPVAIHITNMPGKFVSRGRVLGKRSDFKKAIVTLASGQTITHEGV